METDVLIRDLLTEARRQRAFKFRLDAMLRELPEGTTAAVLERSRLAAHQSETALCLEADVLNRYVGLEEI
jgi:hypothetical protein